MVCRDAAVEDALAIARVWVAAWQAAYAGLMPAEYLAGLDAEAALPGFERRLSREPVSPRAGAGRRRLSASAVWCITGSRRRPGDGRGDRHQSPSFALASGTGPGTPSGDPTAASCGHGFSEATLWVLHGNARARQFYEELGWRHDGVEKHDDKLTGFALHEVRYRVALVSGLT